MLRKQIKELRTSHNMTQNELAKKLGVSSQTVSKWERGLLSPDISLLPLIADIFHCTIDSLYNRDTIPTQKRLLEFYAKINTFIKNDDWENEYNSWIEEIRTNPEEYLIYLSFLKRIYKKRDFSTACLFEIEKLAGIIEKNCDDIDIKNEFNYGMVHIYGETENEWFSKKTESYFKKLPALKHGRDLLMKYILSGDNLHTAQLCNIDLLSAMLCDTVIEIAEHEDNKEIQLYYYKKAADIYEVIFEDKFGGGYENNLLNYYYQMAVISASLKKEDKAGQYVGRILTILSRHLNDKDIQDTTLLLNSVPMTIVKAVKDSKALLCLMLEKEELKPFHNEIADFKNSYFKYFKNDGI